MKAKAMSQCS
jgi:chromosome segregation ATPase